MLRRIAKGVTSAQWRRLREGGLPPKRFKNDAVKAHDDKLYGGWKSADIIFAEAAEKPNIVGRWDWHLWQFLIALTPAGMMYALAQYARREMEADERTKAEKAAEEAGLAAKIAEGVEERLATIEAALQALQSSVQPREEKPPEKKVEESSSTPIKTPAEDESRKPPP